MIKLLHQRCIT